MDTILIMLITIFIYYLLGWITLWISHFTHKFEMLLTANDILNINGIKIPMFYLWPVFLFVILFLWLTYIPYLLINKFTPGDH